MKRIVACYILLLILVCGCFQRQSPKEYVARYGIEYNSVRDSLGIVLLDSSWVAFKVWDGVTAWGPQEKKVYPCHVNKQMAYFNDTLYCELDVYGNGEKYETPDGLNSVNLKVMYFYRPSRSGPWAGLTYSDNAVGWYCVYEGGPGTPGRISKEKADSIIKLWRIKN